MSTDLRGCARDCDRVWQGRQSAMGTDLPGISFRLCEEHGGNGVRLWRAEIAELERIDSGKAHRQEHVDIHVAEAPPEIAFRHHDECAVTLSLTVVEREQWQIRSCRGSSRSK